MRAPSSVGFEHEIGAAGLLAIRARAGEVRLRAVDGGTVRVMGDDDLDASAEIERGTGSLSIRSRGDGWFAGGRAGRRLHDLAIDVPRRATVVVETASGRITVDGLLGDQRYRTTSGDLVLREVAGRLSVQAVSGDVDAMVVGDADIDARTVSGDLGLRAATVGALRVATTSGDLRLAGRLAGPGPFSIETVSGDALLALAGDIRVELQTVAGDIRSEIDAVSESGHGRRSLTIGTTGPTLRVRSMSGDVRLIRPTAVTRPAVVAATDVAPVPRVDHAEVEAGDPTDAARLAILRSLERGEIDVAEASRRLEALDVGTEAVGSAPAIDAEDAMTGEESIDV